MHDTSYKSALARRACRYSDARPPRKTDGVLLESELPPHMRGKGRRRVRQAGRAGITPAYAGKRRRPAFLLGGTQDHPRICGEKMNASVKAIELRGSPPHMRGKGQLGQRLECGPGITPAYAGKRKACAKNAEMSWDHPRICGEKLSFLGGLTDGPESPPPPPNAGGGGVPKGSPAPPPPPRDSVLH